MRTCTFDGCDKQCQAKGLCSGHYLQQRKGQELQPLRVVGRQRCEAGEGLGWSCLKKHCAKGLCNGHRAQAKSGASMRPLTAQANHVTEKREHEKWCSDCREWLPKGEFARNGGTFDGLRSTCRSCSSDSGLMTRHNITREQWVQMLADQGGGCAICGTRDSGGAGSWHVDHDHACCPGKKSCGKCVRGLLCHRCNVGLGQFQDSSHLLFAAAGYLQRYDRAFAVSPQ